MWGQLNADLNDYEINNHFHLIFHKLIKQFLPCANKFRQRVLSEKLSNSLFPSREWYALLSEYAPSSLREKFTKWGERKNVSPYPHFMFHWRHIKYCSHFPRESARTVGNMLFAFPILFCLIDHQQKLVLVVWSWTFLVLFNTHSAKRKLSLAYDYSRKHAN